MFQNQKLDNKPSLRQLPPNLHLAKTNAKETLSHHQMLTGLFLMTQENGSIIARVWGWFAYSYCSAYHRQDHGCLYAEVWGVYEEERWCTWSTPTAAATSNGERRRFSTEFAAEAQMHRRPITGSFERFDKSRQPSLMGYLRLVVMRMWTWDWTTEGSTLLVLVFSLYFSF